MTILAVIPARGGSKRLPGKNMKLLAGKPLIQWTIEAALETNCIDETLVSSDSGDVIRLANSFGQLAPFERPGTLATDTASSSDVAVHALKYAESEGRRFDYLALLQPTCPLRTAADIEDAFACLRQTNANSLVSVSECEKSPLWSASLSSDGTLEFIGDKCSLEKRSQNLPIYYALNGAIYFVSSSFMMEKRSLFDVQNCIPYIMPRDKSVDIDTARDFEIAEVLLRKRQLNT